MPKAISQKTKNQIIALRKKGNIWRDIAEKTGVAIQSVALVLRNAGLTNVPNTSSQLREYHGNDNVFPAEDLAQLIRYVSQGRYETARRYAREVCHIKIGPSFWHIHGGTERVYEETEPLFEDLPTDQKAKIASLHSQGRSYAYISNKLDIDRRLVSATMEKMLMEERHKAAQPKESYYLNLDQKTKIREFRAGDYSIDKIASKIGSTPYIVNRFIKKFNIPKGGSPQNRIDLIVDKLKGTQAIEIHEALESNQRIKPALGRPSLPAVNLDSIGAKIVSLDKLGLTDNATVIARTLYEEAQKINYGQAIVKDFENSKLGESVRSRLWHILPKENAQDKFTITARNSSRRVIIYKKR